MWYHGRCQDLNQPDKNLPPLSTGRIGRATSRNGVVWTKCPLGSGDEAHSPPGVSLGLNSLALLSFVTLKLAKSAVWPAMAKAAKAAVDSSIFGRVWGVLVTSSRFGAVFGG